MRNPFDDPFLREQLRRTQELQNNPVHQHIIREQERLARDPAHRYLMQEIERQRKDPLYQHIMREQEKLNNNPVYQQLIELEKNTRNNRTGIELYNTLEGERRAIKALTEINQSDKLWKQVLESERLLRRNRLLDDTRNAANIYYASTNAITQQFIDNEALTPRNAKYVEQLLEPMKNHAHFATETLNQLAKTEFTTRETTALRSSLTLSNHQIAQLSAVITQIVVPPSDTTRERSPRIKFNLFEIQQKELLEQTEPISEKADYEDIAPLAPSSESAGDALECISLYKRCNESRRFKGEEPFFKPTAQGILSAAYIVMIVADSKDKFDFLIDHLYMLFYEGTGASKIKLLKENGGIMERAEGEVIWDIKQLRSKRSRHDIEHGTEGEIKKKYRDLEQMYKRLGLSRFPQTSEEFKLLQHNLLKNLRTFLTEVAERIEKQDY